MSRKERCIGTFDMIFQEYENKEIGPELLKTFNEDLDPALLETLEAYSMHKDYNRLRTEVDHFASKLQIKSLRSFNTFEESVWYYIDNQLLSQNEGRTLFSLNHE